MRSKGMGTLCGSVAALLLVLGPAVAQDPAPAAPPAGLSTGPATIPTHWSKYSYPTSIPDGATYYVIVRGDTLWGIAKRFLNNPYLWPQIWEENKYITDAHWIYPGDPLIMPKVALVSERAGEAGAAAVETPATEEAARAEVVRTTGGVSCEGARPTVPSPTRGEGTLWHCSAQPKAALAYMLVDMCSR